MAYRNEWLVVKTLKEWLCFDTKATKRTSKGKGTKKKEENITGTTWIQENITKPKKEKILPFNMVAIIILYTVGALAQLFRLKVGDSVMRGQFSNHDWVVGSIKKSLDETQMWCAVI